MIFFPNAKINIGLNIIEKRNDGFHNLETVFYPIKLSDILEFTETNGNTSFSETGLNLNIEDNQNLVLKAYYLLKDAYNLPELKIHLHKIIPFGAGLGGGSSDAAFMLRYLNEYFDLQIPEEELIFLAGQLGSDCPFFIRNKPVFAEGTGNVFSDIDLDLSRYYILTVKPDVRISTKDAFSEIKPRKTEYKLTEFIKYPINEWKNYIVNDFEKPIFRLYPEIGDIKNILYDNGALFAQMSGSGSTVYGIFDFMPVFTDKFKNCFVFYDKL